MVIVGCGDQRASLHLRAIGTGIVMESLCSSPPAKGLEHAGSVSSIFSEEEIKETLRTLNRPRRLQRIDLKLSKREIPPTGQECSLD